MKEIPKVHEKFISDGLAQGNRKLFLDYIWDELFAVQLGYSFSSIHTVSYSIIALQEAILNVQYPPIFWATARLLVESSAIDFMEEDLEFMSEVDEEGFEDELVEISKKKSKSVNYFKMSAAMGEVRGFGVTILPPSINKSSFSFRPDVEENAIYFGLKGLNRIGDGIIKEVINNRPFKNMEDFFRKVKVNKIQATMLIKAGAFDEFGDRQKMLYDYCDSVADKKKVLNMRNAQMLISDGFIPETFEKESQLFNFNKYIRKDYKFGEIFVLISEDLEFLNYFGFSEVSVDEHGSEFFHEKDWKKFYDSKMLPIKDWIKENHDDLLERVNEKAVQTMRDKYAVGNIAKQEMEALSYYHSYHELDTPEYKEWLQRMGVSNFEDLPEDPVVEYVKNGRKYFKLYRIAGTSIGRDKAKSLVGLESPGGFLKVKFYRSQFLKFDKQVKLDGVRESSWFSKGEKLLLSGYRAGDQFVVKTYYGHQFGQPVYKFEEPGRLISTRLGEE